MSMVVEGPVSQGDTPARPRGAARAWTVAGVVVVVIIAAAGLTVVIRHVMRTGAVTARRLGQPIPVMVVPAARRELREVVGATGEVAPVEFVSLTARVSARVERVDADLGDLVSPGKVLVRMDADPLRAAVARAETELQQANGDAERATQQLERVRRVFDQHVLPVTDLEAAEGALAAAKARKSEAAEKLVHAQLDLRNADVTAPVVGIVTERLVNAGETPQPGQKLLTIGRIQPVLVAAKVSEEHAGAIHLQQPATVTFGAFPNDVSHGEVVKLDPVADPETRTLRVFVRIPNPDLKLKPGLTAFVRLEQVHPAALAVPSVALVNPTGLQESAVFVVGDDLRARFRKVKVGAIAEGMTGIVDGLAEGDRVVTVGQMDLREGDQVRIGDEFEDLKKKAASPRPDGAR
jgi:RND family efflux transporter MFP subunit